MKFKWKLTVKSTGTESFHEDVSDAQQQAQSQLPQGKYVSWRETAPAFYTGTVDKKHMFTIIPNPKGR